jgi:diaminopropionate ammonia-lyase
MIISNPWYGKGLPDFDPSGVSVAVDAPLRLLQHCPVAQATPLANCSDLAKRLGLAGLHVKDERTRMRLGSFKALGAKRAARGGDMPWEDTLKREVFVTASAGNHGLSVAAGARIFGAKAVIFLSESVPGDFADRLRSFGAEVVISGKTYEDSMSAALDRVKNQGGQILSDTTWPECYTGVDIMEGYLVMAAEAFDAIDTPPTHLFLQAGVGGLAAAVAAYARQCYGDAPRIIVVEPDAAPALMQAVEKGRVVSASGDVSIMGRLDCKEASEVALAGLAAHANDFMTISDADCTHLIAELEDYRLAMDQGLLDLNDQSRVLLFLSEGPIDA